jgi:RHS repeat-associated protein
MQMPERNFSSNKYRYGFNGKENDNSTGEGNVDLGARIANVCLGRFFFKDPDEKKYPFQSTYVLASNNPVCLIDINGKGTNSTHIGKSGKVIAVIKDGDKGVYQHQDNTDGKTPTENQIKLRQKIYKSTAANGTKVGETWTELGFAEFGAYEKDGRVKPAEGAKIDINSKWANDKVSSIIDANPTIATYAIKARDGHEWDIKIKTPNGNVYFGSLLFGKYASARDAGNFTAGAVAQKSIIDNRILDYGFGTYNQSGNKVGKSLIQIAGDILFSIMPDTQGQAEYEIKNTILNGEDKLSKAGIEAGKEYIKNKK